MRIPLAAVLALALMAQASVASAQTSMVHSHPQMSVADGRELVHFPPPMHDRMLANMRDHVETLNRILDALGSKDYAGAAKIAVEHLGLDSPSAAACKPAPEGASAPAPDSMDAMMAQFMPEPMRAVGLSMHTAATEFAVASQRAAATQDTTAAVEALSRVTQNCVACHAAYKLH
jgi:hypothetical protein